MSDVTLCSATIVLAERVYAGALHISGTQIAATKPRDAWQPDLRDYLLFPGLVNAHEHLHLNNIPALPPHAPFPNSYAWIEAFQPYFSAPHVAAAVGVPAPLRYWQGGLKNLLAGATTVAHHDPWHPALDTPGFPVRVLREYGWSHSLGLGSVGSRQTAGARNPSGADGQLPTADCRLPQYGPPIPASYHDTPPNLPWFIHLAEGSDAVAAGELALLEALGCLGANTVLVHGVGLSERDVERVIARGARVVWCPASNLALLGSTLQPRRLLAAGRLALGSDSRIAGGHDLLDELRVAAQHADLRPAELLWLATAGGARALALPDVGGLAPGQRADILVVPDRGEDPHAVLVGLRRAEIAAVVRDGLPQIADPCFADWFAACGIDAVPVLLDGHPKLLAAQLARAEAVALEPGLELRMKDEG